jgi:hypothetical protein
MTEIGTQIDPATEGAHPAGSQGGPEANAAPRVRTLANPEQGYRLSLEMMEQIRCSPLSSRALAECHGVDHKTVGKIKSGTHPAYRPGTRRDLSEEDIAAIVAGSGGTRKLSLQYGVSRERIRKIRTDASHERQRAMWRDRQEREWRRPPGSPKIYAVDRRPPPEVLAEAAAVAAAPRTLGMVMCGDPPIGRRALDRKNQSAPSDGGRRQPWSPMWE